MLAASLDRPRLPRRLVLIGATLLVILIAGVWFLRTVYANNLKPLSTSQEIKYFSVAPGNGVHQISVNLQKSKLIRNGYAFETYVRSNELHDQLQAGTYGLSPSMSVQQIVRAMVNGDVAKNLVTILPGKRLDQLKVTFAKAGYGQAAIDAAFNAAAYTDHPALASLPKGASLEGYLYPDSFQKNSQTPAEAIIRESLDEMQKKLTPDLIAGFGARSLNLFQAITLASIIEQETDDLANQPVVAQVFLSRLSSGLALGSDVTAFYSSALAGVPASVNTDSPYNTRLHTGLPPGPIGTVTASALAAVAHPANTSYLYFITGDDKKMHFSNSEAEHQAAIQQFCAKSCGH